MPKREFTAGLDVGTNKVALLVGEMRDGSLSGIVGVGVSPSHGLKKGMVVDIDATVRAISESVEKAERMVGFKLRSVSVAISGPHISCLNNHGVVAVAREDKEVTEYDVARAIEAARVINLSADREIIHVIPRGFILDGCNGIRDPVGLLGTRLEVEAHIVTAGVNAVQNILRSVYKAGLEIENLVLSPLASGEAVLLPAEMELGVAVADVGGGTTDLAVFCDGALWFTSVIPIGGDYITMDLAVGLRTPINEAERIKVNFGTTFVEEASDSAMIEVRSVGGEEVYKFSEKEVAKIIEPRVEEIFSMIKVELQKSGYSGVMPGGIVLTGGCSKLKGLRQFAENYLGMPVRIGVPYGVSGLPEVVNNPLYASGIGLLKYAASARNYALNSKVKEGPFSWFTQRVKELFKNFL